MSHLWPCLIPARGAAAALALMASLAYGELKTPPSGKLYHSVYPGGRSGAEDDLKPADVKAYQSQAGAKAAWIYFSNNWYRSRHFPRSTVAWIRRLGAVPYVRLMLRSSNENPTPEPKFTLKAILDGKFDADLARWAQAARSYGGPLLVEYGTECNGEWFAWNGKWNGGGTAAKFGDPGLPDGPERFAAAYRHIIDVMRQNGAANIQWVFHINAESWPETKWNQPKYYYPGDDYIDFVGISAYGAQTPLETESSRFRSMIDPAYEALRKIAPTKPVAILEFGCTAGNPVVDQAEWAKDALHDILSNRWPKLFAFSWWNERWENDDDSAHDTTMRLQDNPELANVFRSTLHRHRKRIVTRPILGP